MFSFIHCPKRPNLPPDTPIVRVDVIAAALLSFKITWIRPAGAENAGPLTDSANPLT